MWLSAGGNNNTTMMCQLLAFAAAALSDGSSQAMSEPDTAKLAEMGIPEIPGWYNGSHNNEIDFNGTLATRNNQKSNNFKLAVAGYQMIKG